MGHVSSLTGRAFLSLVTAPEGMARDRLAQVIAGASGLDARTVQLRLGLVPPLIVSLMGKQAAASAVAAIKSAQGDAFAPTMDDIEALGPTLKIRDMRIGDGIHMELWRGPAVTLTPQEIQIVVRARTPGSEQKPLNYESPVAYSNAALRPTGIPGDFTSLVNVFGLGGAFGIATSIRRGNLFDGDSYAALPIITTPQVLPSHKLDLHTVDGRVFQIDGDKFGFRVLGDQRGMSDNVNIDRMCELVVHLNPDVIVDTYFGVFLPPAGHHRLHVPMMKINNDNVAFAFYSRWSALMYRYVLQC